MTAVERSSLDLEVDELDTAEVDGDAVHEPDDDIVDFDADELEWGDVGDDAVYEPDDEPTEFDAETFESAESRDLEPPSEWMGPDDGVGYEPDDESVEFEADELDVAEFESFELDPESPSVGLYDDVAYAPDDEPDDQHGAEQVDVADTTPDSAVLDMDELGSDAHDSVELDSAAGSPAALEPAVVDDAANAVLVGRTANDPYPRAMAVDSNPMLRGAPVPAELAEALRWIINRREMASGTTPRTVAVTSAFPAEGVTTISAALAAVMARETAGRVCWVDFSWLTAPGSGGDRVRPSLIDVMRGSAASAAFSVSPELPNLVTLSPGTVAEAERHRVVRSKWFEELLAALREEFDHVVYDLPPLLTHANTLAVVKHAESFLLVVRHRRTSKADVRRACDAMDPIPNLGVVINRSRSRTSRRRRRR